MAKNSRLGKEQLDNDHMHGIQASPRLFKERRSYFLEGRRIRVTPADGGDVGGPVLLSTGTRLRHKLPIGNGAVNDEKNSGVVIRQ